MTYNNLYHDSYNDLYNKLFNDKFSIGNKLREHRKNETNLSQETVAEATGVCSGTIQNIENAQAGSLETIAIYATVLGLDPVEVLFKPAYQPAVSAMESQVHKFLCSLSKQQKQSLLAIIKGI